MTAAQDDAPGRAWTDKAYDLFETHTYVVYFALIGLLYLGVKTVPYGPMQVNGAAMEPLLSDGGQYLTIKGPDAACIGDAVTTPHPEKEADAIRMVMALGGDRVVFGETGYRIAGRTMPMSEAWLSAARTKGGDALTVPQGRVMLRRVSPDAMDPSDYEAFFTVAASDINEVVIRALRKTGQGFWSHVPRPRTRCISTTRRTA